MSTAELRKKIKKSSFSSIKNSAFSLSYSFAFPSETQPWIFILLARRTRISLHRCLAVLNKLSYHLLTKLQNSSSLVLVSFGRDGRVCSPPPGIAPLVIRHIDWKYRFSKNTAKGKENIYTALFSSDTTLAVASSERCKPQSDSPSKKTFWRWKVLCHKVRLFKGWLQLRIIKVVFKHK